MIKEMPVQDLTRHRSSFSYSIAHVLRRVSRHRGRHLGDGAVREEGVRCGGTGQDVQHQWVIGVSHHSGRKPG